MIQMAQQFSILLLYLCVLVLIISPTLVSSQPFFVVKGYVYCDTCRCGFENSASTPIPGAIVRVECRDGEKWEKKYSKEGVTNSKGKYTILVSEDHNDQICKVLAVSSPNKSCNEIDKRRSNSATVILTNNNGLTNNIRFANGIAFFAKRPLPLCPSLLKQYLEFDDPL